MRTFKEIRRQEYIKRLSDTQFSYVGGFIDNHRKCVHCCKICGQQRIASPKEIKHGITCDRCFPPLRREEGAAHVYILCSCDEPVKLKIGFSRKMADRIQKLSAATPFPFRLLGKKLMTVAAARTLERGIHRALFADRVYTNRPFEGANEWYYFTEKVAEHLDSLNFDFITDKIFSAVTLRLRKKRKIV